MTRSTPGERGRRFGDEEGFVTQQLSPRETEEARRRRYVPGGHPVSWMMLLVSTLAILITSVDRVILPTLLPAILTEFNLTETQGGFLNSLSFAGTFVGAIVLGVLGDSLGRGSRRAWSWMGTVLVTIIGSVGTFFTNTLGGLQLWRVVMGVGTGGMKPVNVAMVGERWHHRQGPVSPERWRLSDACSAASSPV